MPDVLQQSGSAIRIAALASNLIEELDGRGNWYRSGILCMTWCPSACLRERDQWFKNGTFWLCDLAVLRRRAYATPESPSVDI